MKEVNLGWCHETRRADRETDRSDLVLLPLDCVFTVYFSGRKKNKKNILFVHECEAIARNAQDDSK